MTAPQGTGSFRLRVLAAAKKCDGGAVGGAHGVLSLYNSGLGALAVAKADGRSVSPDAVSSLPFGRFVDGGALTGDLVVADVAERVSASSSRPGRWVTPAGLAVSTSEMGGPTVWAGCLHIIGG